MNMPATAKSIIMMLCIIALINCSGWHLRGSVASTPLKPTHLISAQNPVAPILTRLLQQRDALASADNAVLQLQLGQEKTRKRSASVTQQGITREYELTLTFPYEIREITTNTVASSSQVRITRTYLFDPNDVASQDKEASLLLNEMRHSAARQLIRQLYFLQGNQH